MMKYLFTAKYKDGSVYEQNPEDVSVTESEKRSCFYDIKDTLEDLESFTLTGEGHIYKVDLIDGHFEVDGVPFDMHEENLKDFRLIYFRQHTHSFNQKVEETVEFAHNIVFRFGWQTNDSEGKNYQRVMQIN